MSIRIVMHDSKEYSFDRDIVRIGKSSRSDIVLAGDGILQEHAELQRIGGRWLIKMSGDQPLTVDGTLRESLVWLQPGNRVAFNQAGVGFQFDPPVSARSTRPAAVAVSTPKLHGTQKLESTDADFGDQRTPSEQRRAAEYQPPADKRYPVASGALLLGILLAVGGIAVSLKPNSDSDSEGNEKSNTSDQNSADSPVAPNEPKETDTVTPPPAPNASVDVASEVKKRCMMIGFEKAGKLELFGQCWAASPDEVVTSAVFVEYFKNAAKDRSLRLFVHSGQTDDEVVYIPEGFLKNHPGFTTSGASAYLDALGVLLTEKPLPKVSREIEVTELTSEKPVKAGQLLRQIGFSTRGVDGKGLFQKGTTFMTTEHEVTVTKIDPPPGDRVRVTIADWDNVTKDVLEGSVVVDQEGVAVGILANYDLDRKTFDLVRADRMPAILRN